jgi:hypothetical protein
MLETDVLLQLFESDPAAAVPAVACNHFRTGGFSIRPPVQHDAQPTVAHAPASSILLSREQADELAVALGDDLDLEHAVNDGIETAGEEPAQLILR